MPSLWSRRSLGKLTAAAPYLQTRGPRLPNLLLILSDDHSVPHLGCYGDPVIQTPHLDRFASQGMRLDRMFTAAPQCVPSRSALLTGKSPVANRMGRFASPMPPEVKTLPELLRAKGYRTGVCRRNFHLDGVVRPAPVTQAAYDKYDMRTWSKRVDFLHVGGNRTQTVDLMNQFLNTVSNQPFFLWINFNDPHHVWDRNAIPKPHNPARIPLAKHMPDLPGMRDDVARHYDEISRMDEEFSWVIDNLKRRGLEENTLVLFMGDNGHALPHGKGSLYDPGLNVPCLARWPGQIAPGSSSRSLLSGEDVTPTFLEAAGLPTSKDMTGRSFLKLLEGSSAYEPRKHIFASRLPHGEVNFNPNTKADEFDLSRCARSATHKLIWNYTPYQHYQPVDSHPVAGWQETLAAHKAGKLPPEIDRAYFTHPRPIVELYDLEKDPSELTNLAGQTQLAPIEEELKRALTEKMTVDYDFLPPPLAEAQRP